MEPTHKNFGGKILLGAFNLTSQQFEYLLDPEDLNDPQNEWKLQQEKKLKKKNWT